MKTELTAKVRKAIPGSVWIVSGSSRGIGRETARCLLEQGAFVVLHGRSLLGIEKTAAALYESTGCDRRNIALCAGDTCDAETASELVKTAVDTFGKLDGAILNAGQSMRAYFEETEPEVIRQIIETNLLGTAYCLRAVLPELKKTRGLVVLVSSLAGLRGFPNTAVYSASRMALHALAESVSFETQGSGMHISVIALGFTENDPDKRILSASGELVRHSRSAGATQRQSAVAIIHAAFSRRRFHVTTISGHLFYCANRCIPYAVTWLLRKSGGRIHGKGSIDQK